MIILEVSKNKKCKFEYFDNNSKKFACSYPALLEDKYCIFHSKNVEAKEEDFKHALERLISKSEKDRATICYDFKGFIFPSISFKNKVFIKELDLRKAQFIEMADFENCEFKSDIICHKTIFHNKAFFQGAIFYNNVSFIASEFNKLIFVGGAAMNKVVFHGCKFYDNAVFRGRSFNSSATFQSSIFYKDVDFQWVKFHKLFDLSNSTFHMRIIFENTQFLDEVKFSKTNISLIKNLNAPGVDFEGAILQSANFFEIKNFINYSFNKSYLLSCDFSNKKFVNCDFTGAVLKAIHSDNIDLDDSTIQNTKYIYTDYLLTENEGEKTYEPNQNSRVPLKGYFGDSENSGFTLNEFLKEQNKWVFLLDLPDDIRTGVLNYINFFKDYSKKVNNTNIYVSNNPEGEKTRVTLLADPNLKSEEIASTFKEYIANIFKPFSQLNIGFRNTDLSEYEKAIFLLNYENELNTTQIRLKYGLENKNDITKFIDTVSSILLAEKDKQNDTLIALLNKMIESTPKIPNLNFNTQLTANQYVKTTFENKLDIDLGLSKMLDELKNLERTDENVVTDLKNEIMEIKDRLKNNSNQEETKNKIKKFLITLGKIGDYGIQNFDKILNIGNAISKMI